MPPPYGNGSETNAKGHERTFAAAVFLVALTSTALPEASQQQIAFTLRASVLRPFIATQEGLNDARRRAGDVDVLTARLDSLSAIFSTQSAVMDENRTLRAMLGLVERGGPRFMPATVLRPGTSGSESMFIVDVGTEDGIPEGAPVVGPSGLVGVIREVRTETSIGMDWNHPDFRVSAMLADGTAYGIVETRRGRFREDDRLILNATAYVDVRLGTEVVTSGLGRRFPRGIPVGRIDRLLETEGSWRKSFWMEPMVEPGSVTHVLVLTDGNEGDVSGVWPIDPSDSREEADAGSPR